MSTAVEMPRLSYIQSDGVIEKWHLSPGCKIKSGDCIAQLNIGTAQIDLQASEDGTLQDILHPEGTRVSLGTPIALVNTTKNFNATNVKISPLAAKLLAESGLNISLIKGTGPRGKIMANDVKRAEESQKNSPAKKIQTPPIPKGARRATRINDFYLFSLEANMAYLAAISTPIAVQCEKLMGARYSVFDYVVRAAIKACITAEGWPTEKEAHVRLMLDKGDKEVFIPSAEKKTIHLIAMARLTQDSAPTDESPTLLLCDSGIESWQAKDDISPAPLAIISIGGTTPKTGIEAGRPVSKLILPVSLFINAKEISDTTASKIAAEFKTLLENPVLLLLN